MSVLERSELQASPLADLHAIANQLGIDGFRRLRKAELIDVIVAAQPGSDAVATDVEEAPRETEEAPREVEEAASEVEETPRAATRPRSRRRGGHSRALDGDAGEDVAAEDTAEAAPVAEEVTEEVPVADSEPVRPRSRRRSTRIRAVDADAGEDVAAEVSAPEVEDVAPAADAEAEDVPAADSEPRPSTRRSSTRRRRTTRADQDAPDAEREEPVVGEVEVEVEAVELAQEELELVGELESELEVEGELKAESALALAGEIELEIEIEGFQGDGNPPLPPRDEVVAVGVVEVLPNGSAFLRVNPPEPSDDDVYISAAQVRRCELVSGDSVSGPARAPRRSERYPSLLRVDTINGGSSDPVAEAPHYDELPAAFPSDRFSFGSEDTTLKAIEWLTPLGYGSRAVIVGAARAGKTEALRRLAVALAAQDGLDVTVVLAGARPEEIGEWRAGPVAPAAALSFAASADAQGQAVERAVDTARRVAARGGDAVVLIDSLDGLHPPVARKALAAARNIVGGGSLTIIATAAQPYGGETTVVALDVALASTARLPALDLVASGTLRPELLVGQAGAEAIAQARAAALE